MRQAIDAGAKINVNVADFLIRAIKLAGGRCQRDGDLLQVPAVPLNWIGGRVPAKYDALYLNYATAPRGMRHGEILDDDHDLVQRAVCWVREGRYNRQEDHRMAVRLVPDCDQPDLVATFIATLRAGDHTEMEELVAVRITADGRVDPDGATELLHQEGTGNVPPGRVQTLFGAWWEAAVEKAGETGRQRAERWRESVRQKRFSEQGELKRQFDLWARVTARGHHGRLPHGATGPARHGNPVAACGPAPAPGTPQTSGRVRRVSQSAAGVRDADRGAVGRLAARARQGGEVMEPVTFQGGAFSEYYCTKLLWTDPQLASKIDLEEARKLYKRASSVIRQAQRRLDGKVMPRSTCSDLLQPLAEVLGWRLGEAGKVVTELEQEEEAGVPLLAEGRDGPLARAVCISPVAHLDAAPAGLHRRFAPTLSLARVLSEENLDYGLLLNAYELRLVCNVGTLPSFIAFQLADIGEGTEPGWNAWRLLFTLLRQPALAEEPGLLDQVRKIGAEHQQSVSTLLGRQVQQAVVRFMQGVLDHPENRDRLPEQISDAYLHTLYEQTLRLLYRLLFCLYAEDLNLLPMDMLTYRDGYSLKRMIRLAKGQAANSLVIADPNGRFFQESLQALFALLRSGCNLGPEGAIQAYGGGLFDPGGTELIDGLAWGNAAVDDILELLNRVPAPKGQTGWVQLSYRELNVEQLGSIYEGLLEQTPAYAQTRVWQAELDSRIIVIDDANRQRIREVRGEKAAADALALEDEEEDGEDAGVAEGSDTEEEDQAAVDDEEQEQRPRKQSAKKPLRVLAEIRAGTVYLKGGLGRKQTGSYYTNRAFVNFLVREALEPLAEGRCPKEILALKVVDPAMGSAHFLVGACRRLAEHLLAAYRREVARIQAEDKKGELLEDDLLVLADVPPELAHVWSPRDQERELAVCRLLVAGNCIYGVDKNPLAVDLAKVSLWLVTAASRMPLSFLDHRLRCGDSLLGIPAEEVVRPWVPETNGTRGRKAKAAGRKPTNPVELLISPKHGQDTFDYFAPSRRALCQSFTRAFACLRQLLTSIEADPANFLEHRAQHAALRGTLEPWWQAHQLRVGMAFEPTAPDPEILNHWLEDLLNVGRVSDEHREPGERFRQSGEDQGAFLLGIGLPRGFLPARRQSPRRRRVLLRPGQSSVGQDQARARRVLPGLRSAYPPISGHAEEPAN